MVTNKSEMENKNEKEAIVRSSPMVRFRRLRHRILRGEALVRGSARVADFSHRAQPKLHLRLRLTRH
jgi:hypothetical protein